MEFPRHLGMQLDVLEQLPLHRPLKLSEVLQWNKYPYRNEYSDTGHASKSGPFGGVMGHEVEYKIVMKNWVCTGAVRLSPFYPGQCSALSVASCIFMLPILHQLKVKGSLKDKIFYIF